MLALESLCIFELVFAHRWTLSDGKLTSNSNLAIKLDLWPEARDAKFTKLDVFKRINLDGFIYFTIWKLVDWKLVDCWKLSKNKPSPEMLFQIFVNALYCPMFFFSIFYIFFSLFKSVWATVVLRNNITSFLISVFFFFLYFDLHSNIDYCIFRLWFFFTKNP